MSAAKPNTESVRCSPGWPELLTEAELAAYLRLPAASGSAKPQNVVANLRRKRNLPSLAISNRLLYPLDLIREWVKEQAQKHDSASATT